ncbi:ATP-binding cassette domain-containing protein [Imhoffiella purpurea]|uniref:ABC-type hydroxamate-type ferric siderophore transporter n=1 Tax=Imhoffiella purpurea TaxID=1249627 RepID=W9V9B0_9GAMM|nr:ATP-binding cassette domain-containing protein [Imhoffiella purpurea]EXJ16193.1 ABC-type hydroxamate-type ferric siderophore transporter [Imhoffiella purpurea]
MRREDRAEGSASLGDRLLALFGEVGTRAKRRRPGVWRGLIGGLDDGGILNLSLVALLSAVCGTAVLLLLNAEAREVEYHGYSDLIAFGFLALLVIYRWSQNYLIREATQAIELALHERRLSTTRNVLRLSLEDVQALGLRSVIDGIGAHYGTLSQTLVPIVAGVEGVVLLVFMFGYLVILSPMAAALTTVVVAVTVMGFLASRSRLDEDLSLAVRSEEAFRDLAEGLVRGKKELRLNPDKRSAFQNDMIERSEELAICRSNAAAHFASMLATGNSASYLMAGAVVFVLPLITGVEQTDISRIVVAVIFLLGPISSVVQTFQQVTTARFALAEIGAFQDRVEALADRHDSDRSNGRVPAFQELRLESLSYSHAGENGFSIRDIDLQLQKGEILFVTGGNGSGKTTLLRIITGLYPRHEGAMRLNGERLAHYPPQSYRNLFASVFSDFHVFQHPYGLDDAGLERLEQWLVEFDIRHKLGDDLGFIDANALSTGQKKRVGLALALAEQRQILVLDEWAADQDPATRRRFYHEILPRLKAEGLTILAVTHDDSYFDCCDRRLHMAEGRITEDGEAWRQ